MSKKLWIPIVAVLLVALFAGAWISFDALAQGEMPGRLALLRRARPVLGQVTAVAKDQFTIQTRMGAEVTFLVNENTRFRSREQTDLTFADVKTGLWVSVVAERGAGSTEKPLAHLVILVPEDIDPSKMAPSRGRVVSVDVSGNQFTLEDRQGQKTTLSVDKETIFRGEATDLASLEQGMAAITVAEKLESGDLLARNVRAGFLPLRVAGEISAVNAAGDEFTLKTAREGKEVTFTVNDKTLFRSKDDALQSLGDLKPGMMGLVVAKSQPGDTFLATLVTAGNKEDLPQVDQRVVGRITSIGADSITVKNRDNQEYTFQVIDETSFRSRGNLVQGLADLRQGMAVAVGAVDLGNGQYQAQWIQIMPRLRR